MSMNLGELKNKSIQELSHLATQMDIENAATMRKQELLFSILRNHDRKSGELRAQGVLEVLPDGFGFLRAPDANYLPGPEDIYVSPSQIRRFNLQTGDSVEGVVRPPKESERYFALLRVETVNDKQPDEQRNKIPFESLAAAYPNVRLSLAAEPQSAVRLVDLFAPLGFGQRCLIAGPPKSGQSTLLRELGKGIAKNNPKAALIGLLVDARPEDVAEFKLSVPGEMVTSTFDESAARHIQIAEIAIERAKRIAENGGNVVVLFDSLTRLARAYSNLAPPGQKTLAGGLDVSAPQKLKRLLSAARRLEAGGSLTVVATVTAYDSPLDETLLGEFRGVANAEIWLDPALSGQRIYPAIDLKRSGTLRDELLVDDKSRQATVRARAKLTAMEPAEAARHLAELSSAHPKNDTLLSKI
jgi:transcription termination factor Rho